MLFVLSRKKIFKTVATVFALFMAARLYHDVTGGFSESNIYPDYMDIQASVEIPSSEDPGIQQALGQPYFWLGKGCQSYVFESQDGRYVIKFIKHQRMRPKPWHSYFMKLPLEKIPFLENSDWVKKLRDKESKKSKKLAELKKSWRLAEQYLSRETGVLYAQIGKGTSWPALTIYDKIGIKHSVDLDKLEFLLQKKAMPLCEYISVKALSTNMNWEIFFRDLVELVVGEYRRGLVDNDQALMQNTGVIEGVPMHLDVGQFQKSKKIEKPDVYFQHLFDKMYKFRLWLGKHYPKQKLELDRVLDLHLEGKLATMSPLLRDGGVAALDDD